MLNALYSRARALNSSSTETTAISFIDTCPPSFYILNSRVKPSNSLSLSAGKALETDDREAGSEYFDSSLPQKKAELLEHQPETHDDNNGVEMTTKRERSRSPLESREQEEHVEQVDQDPQLQVNQEQQQFARETEILKERLKADRNSPTGFPLNLPASLTITTKSAKSELVDNSPVSPPTSCPSPAQSPQFPLPGAGLPLLPGLPGQGAPDGPAMAAALQQVLALQQGQGSGQMPSSAALLQQAQALAQLASLAQLQGMFLLQQPGMQQGQQHEVEMILNETKDNFPNFTFTCALH